MWEILGRIGEFNSMSSFRKTIEVTTIIPVPTFHQYPTMSCLETQSFQNPATVALRNSRPWRQQGGHLQRFQKHLCTIRYAPFVQNITIKVPTKKSDSSEAESKNTNQKEMQNPPNLIPQKKIWQDDQL